MFSRPLDSEQSDRAAFLFCDGQSTKLRELQVSVEAEGARLRSWTERDRGTCDLLVRELASRFSSRRDDVREGENLQASRRGMQ